MAFDFPNFPAVGSTYTAAGITYVWDGVAWIAMSAPSQMAQPFNFFVNGGFTVNQEAPTPAAMNTGAQFMCDQTAMVVSLPFGSSAQGQGGTVGNDSVAAITCTQVLASMASGNYVMFSQPLEGVNIRPWNWGLANGSPLVIRFIANGTPGVYSLVLRKPDLTKCFIKAFTLTQQFVNQEIVIPVPPPLADGAWLTTNAASCILYITCAAGPNYFAPAEGWNNGNFLAAPTQGNMMAVALQSLRIGRMGIYLDPGGTGIAPPWQEPDFSSELLRCQRYWRKGTFFNQVGGGSRNYLGLVVPMSPWMRVNPTVTFADNAGNPSRISVGGVSNITIGAGGVRGNADSWGMDALASASMTDNTWWAAIVTANARM